jgi:hypothetical protein
MRILAHAVIALLLAVPTLAQALPPPIGFSLEIGLSPAPGGAAARFAAVTSCWLDGDLEGEVRLGFVSADRPGGRGADALTPALGLRWGPDVGRWRPVLGVEAGARVPAVGQGAAPTAAARAGIELFARREFSVSVAAGWRWTSGAASGPEVIVGFGYYP